MRGAAGVAVVLQGAHYLSGGDETGAQAWLLGVAALIVGALLIAGFVTPIAGGFAAIGAAAIALAWCPQPTPNLFDAATPAIFFIIDSTAVVFLGPGAYSVDARLFGRREIVIPRPARSHEL